MCADGEGAYFVQGVVKTRDLGGGESPGVCFWVNGGMVENLVALKEKRDQFLSIGFCSRSGRI